MIGCTLNEIRAAGPCEDGWRKLLAYLKKTRADDTYVGLEAVLDSNGLEDALWVLDNVIQNRRVILLFAADCAERVLPIFEREYPDDDRPRTAIEASRNPHAYDEELDAAWAAARAAAWAAAAGTAAARAAAAGTAAWPAAWPAAGTAAWPAAWAAAGTSAERDAQSARLSQYCQHGEAAAKMSWPETEGAA